jgi:transposase
MVPFIPKAKAGPGKSGRPPQDRRTVLDGSLWILRTGAPWADLPERYPPRSTCHRCFQAWSRSGVFAKILTALAEDLRDRGGIDLSEGFIDGTFAPAKKGTLAWARPSGAKALKIMSVADTHGLPLAVDVGSVSPHEVTLVEATLDAGFLAEPPRRVGGTRPTTATRWRRDGPKHGAWS